MHEQLTIYIQVIMLTSAIKCSNVQKKNMLDFIQVELVDTTLYPAASFSSN